MRPFSIRTTCSVALLLACASALSAQDTTFVYQGARVRVKFEQITPVTDRYGAVSLGSESVRLVGEVTALESDTLILLPEDAGVPLTIPRRDIDKIEVSQGKKSNWLKGGVVGGGAMLVVAVALGLAASDLCPEEANCAGRTAAVAALGAGLGFAMGASTSAFSKSERWKEAELPAPPPVTLNVGQDGSVRLAFSLRL